MVDHTLLTQTATWDEIRRIHEACDGKILKVIIETCLLTESEKIKMCEIVTNAGAEYIKTSTGFSTAGATFEDIKLMRAHVGKNVKIKAAGGIASLDKSPCHGCRFLLWVSSMYFNAVLERV